MQNFDWTKFTCKINIRSDLKTIYDAFTKSEEIEKWFLEYADFTDEKSRPVPPDHHAQAGYTYHWKWFIYPDTETGKIREANGTDFISFTFEKTCIVDVKLYPQNEQVIVELTQRDIPQDERSKQFIRLGCHAGWSFYLTNLKSVYEGGVDLRNREFPTAGMINS
ncbi:MAG: SRPBCC domain-containing protein [Mucilaginibacter polytrichastri]|nr:SRPBCC domain-containing protein [Mucilaginibacter polytrichastri]